MNYESNPNRGYYSPPPLVTHQTQTMPAPRRRSNAGAWVAAIAVLGIALGAVAATVAADEATPASCIEALEHADELNVLADEYADIAGRAVEAAGTWDEDAMDDLVTEGEDFAARYETALADYETARDDCRGGAL